MKARDVGGVKPVDLTLFRNCSKAAKTQITTTGGDVFIAATCPSDMSVLWGECFGSKERKFLRELLASQVINFSLADTYQVHVRTLFHSSALGSAMTLKTGLRRPGKFVLFLHDLKGDLTTSWTWAKFVRPFHRRGFSIVCVDMPGFGKSSVAQVCSCPTSAWQGDEAHIVAKIMEELGITKCHMLSYGHTAGMVLQVLASTPHRMEIEHVLVNPVFDRHRIFAHMGMDPPPGAGPQWKEEEKARHLQGLIDLLRRTAVKMWFLFDREGKYRDLEHGKAATDRNLRAEHDMAHETQVMLQQACKNEYVRDNLTTTEITREDLCEAQVGKRIPVRMLIPSRHLKASVARFMANYEKRRWDEMYTPNHVAFQQSKVRTGGRAFCAVESRFHDPDHESSDEESERQGATGSAALPAQRALALMPRKSMQNSALSLPNVKSDEQQTENEAIARAQEAIEIQSSQRTPGSSSRGQIQSRNTPAGGRDGAINRAASEGALLKMHSSKTNFGAHALAEHAVNASQRLTRTGANASPMPVTADAARDKKVMNWTKVPFEPDLSYGVRKMFLDAFEASVESYKEEQEREFAQRRSFENRTGMRVLGRGGR